MVLLQKAVKEDWNEGFFESSAGEIDLDIESLLTGKLENVFLHILFDEDQGGKGEFSLLPLPCTGKVNIAD